MLIYLLIIKRGTYNLSCNIKKNTSCFKTHRDFNVNCNKESCRYFLSNQDEHQNCVINMSNNKSHTMEDVGKVFGITRMRICQIEKSIIEKLKKEINVL